MSQLNFHLVMTNDKGEFRVSAHNSQEDAEQRYHNSTDFPTGWVIEEKTWEANLSELDDEQLLGLYNFLSTGKGLKKFKDKADGIARTWKLLSGTKDEEAPAEEAGEEAQETEAAGEEAAEAEEPTEQKDDTVTDKAKKPAAKKEAAKPAKEAAKKPAAKKDAPKAVPKKEAAKAKPAAKKAASGNGTHRGTYKDDQKIKLLVKDNPKRAGGKSAARFDLYKNGMTVAQAKAAGVFSADLVYDSKKGYIEIK